MFDRTATSQVREVYWFQPLLALQSQAVVRGGAAVRPAAPPRPLKSCLSGKKASKSAALSTPLLAAPGINAGTDIRGACERARTAPRAGNRLVGRGSTQQQRRQSAQRWRAVKAFSKPPASSKPVLAWCSGSNPRWPRANDAIRGTAS